MEMERTCKKCGARNADAAGEELDACPRCGAIYSKVEKVIALRAKLDAQTASNQKSANAIPSVVSPNAAPAIPAQRGPGLHAVPLAVWGFLIIVLAPVTIGILEWISPSTGSNRQNTRRGIGDPTKRGRRLRRKLKVQKLKDQKLEGGRGR